MNLQGIYPCPDSDANGWKWTDLRNIDYFLANSDKCRTKAVAKIQWPCPFFSAYFYFKKVKRFGDVPWYSTTIELEDQQLLAKPATRARS